MNYKITELDVLARNDSAGENDNIYLRHGKHYVRYLRPATQEQANEYAGTHDVVPEHLPIFLRIGIGGEKRVQIASEDWFHSLIAWKRAAIFSVEDAVSAALRVLVGDINDGTLLSCSHFDADCEIDQSSDAWLYKWKSAFTFKLSSPNRQCIDNAIASIMGEVSMNRHRITRRLAHMEEIFGDLQASYTGRSGSRKLCRVLEENTDTLPARQYVRGRQLSCLTPPEEESTPASLNPAIEEAATAWPSAPLGCG